MQHNCLPLQIFIKKCSANLNNLETIINKCLFSRHELLAVVPANLIVSELQIKSAIEKAYASFYSNKPISASLSIEFLLYLFATTRIDVALDYVKPKSGQKHYFVVVASKNAQRAAKSLRCVYSAGMKRVEFKLRPNTHKLSKFYGITWLNAYNAVSRIKALELAIIEKQAMLKLGK